MTPRDAFYHLVHDYPGGAPALAARLGMNKHTLEHKADPNCKTHKASFDEVIAAEQLSGDHRPLFAHAEFLGYTLMRVDSLANISDEDLLHDVNRMVKETGECLAAMSAAIEARNITENLIREFEKQSADISPAVVALSARLRAIAAEHAKVRALHQVGRVA